MFTLSAVLRRRQRCFNKDCLCLVILKRAPGLPGAFFVGNTTQAQ
jgi:hypothetical protein